MATVALEVYTSPWPGVNTPVEMRVYRQDDPIAIIASHREADAHLQHFWSFPGLERTNLIFRTFQMVDMAGAGIIQELGVGTYVVPSAKGNIESKAAVQVQADVTPGFISGVNTAVFNDWIGFDIETLERIGTGSLKRGVDYSYDKDTGTVTLLMAGDVFGDHEWYQATFRSNITASADSVAPATMINGARLITVSTNINAGADFGKVIIIDPAATYMEVYMPDIRTVPASKVITFEFRRRAIADQKCCKILFYSDGISQNDYIDWLEGARPDLYMCPGEFISLYKFRDTTDPDNPVDMWRPLNPSGNFMCVGGEATTGNDPENVFNLIQGVGYALDVHQYARLFNDFVSGLPGDYVCNFDDWGNGANKYKFSLANSSFPENAGKFRIPDLSDTFDKVKRADQKPYAFEAESQGSHRHLVVVDKDVHDARFPYERGTLITKLKSIIKYWDKSGGGRETYYLDSDGAEPTLGRTSLPVDNNSNSFPTNKNRPDNIAKGKYFYV